MLDFVKLFDSILGLLVSYPVTIFRILISPEKVFGATESALVSTVGGTFAVSFLVYYVAHSTQLRIQFSNLEVPDTPSKTFFVRIAVFVSLFVLGQYYILSIPLGWPALPTAPLATVKALTYPVSVSMAMYSIAFLFYFILPFRFGRLTIMEKLDANLRDIARESRRERNVKEENAKDVATLIGIVTYVWALYNLSRILFEFDNRQAISATCAMSVVVIFLSLIMICVSLRYDNEIKKLREKVQIPGAADNNKPTQELRETGPNDG